MHHKSRKENNSDNTRPLAYTFTKLGDNLTNNDGDTLNANSNSK